MADSPAGILRAAAERVDTLAAATPETTTWTHERVFWRPYSDVIPDSWIWDIRDSDADAVHEIATVREDSYGPGLAEGVAAWIAALSPALAPALSSWLRATADAVWTYPPFLEEWKGGGDGEYHAGQAAKAALALARLILAGTDTPGDSNG